MSDFRTCPECNGSKVVEHESAYPRPTPNGPCWQSWLDDCQLCGGEGEIEVSPIDIDDLPPPLDPRDPDHSRLGIFAYHNCWKCGDGQRACVRGNPRGCEYPHARND